MPFDLEQLPSWVSQIQGWALVICSAIVGGIIWQFFSKKALRYKANRARKHGHKGEKIAEQWLIKHGFEIINLQDSKQAEFECDSEIIKYRVQPDIIAENEDGRWVVEVKTGKSANPSHGDTRRQILEYAHLYPDYQVALFDADHLLFQPISFFERVDSSPQKRKGRLGAYILGFIFGVCVSVLTFYYLLINS